MTPLIAGIALQGKAPMYEKVYMAGDEKRRARKAAKAKADADRKELALKGFEFDPEGIHQHYIDASTNTFLDGFNKALELDPSTPNYENQVMYIVTETEKKLNAFRDASKAAYTYESEDWQDGHLHSKQVVDFLSNNKFGDDVPPELQDEFGSYGIIYGAKDDGRPVLNVLSGQFAIEDYVQPYQANVDKKKAVWEAMDEDEKSTYVASKKYLEQGYTIPFEMAREDIISYARDPRFYNNVRLTDGFDLNTEEGLIAFYEKYTPNEIRTKTGTVPQKPRDDDSGLTDNLGGSGRNEITLNHEGLETNMKVEMTPLEQGGVVLNLNNAVTTGEAGQKVRMVKRGRLEKVVPVDIGRINIWTGKDATIKPFQYTKEDGTKEMFNDNEPLVLKTGLPVPDELVEYLNRTPDKEVSFTMPNVNRGSYSSEWRIIGKAPLFSGSKTDEQMLIPATNDNILRYLKNLPISSRKKEYEKLKRLGVYDGSYPTGGTPQGENQQGGGTPAKPVEDIEPVVPSGNYWPK
jgi:hypothetical protein